MLKRWLAFLLTVGLVFSSIGTTFAAKPVLGWQTSGANIEIWNLNIEQQSCTPDRSICGLLTPREYWVVNSFGRECLWSADDIMTVSIWARRVSPGETFSFSYCLIGDNNAHLLGITRNSLNFQATLSVDNIISLNVRNLESCIIGPEYDNTYPLPEIAGSNGGVGILHTVTWGVKNTSNKTLRDVGILGFVGPGSYQVLRDRYCTDVLQRFGSYPGPQGYYSN